jgi:hypothetical protein
LSRSRLSDSFNHARTCVGSAMDLGILIAVAAEHCH